MKSHYYCTVHNRSANRRHCVGPGIMLACRIIGSGIATSLNLPLPGRGISRKRRRHWRRQIFKLNPSLNPAWLDATHTVRFIFDANAFHRLQGDFGLKTFPVIQRPPNYEKALNSLLFQPVSPRLKINLKRY